MTRPEKVKHPRLQIFCIECGREIPRNAFREFVLTLDNCCGTELVGLCSKKCWEQFTNVGANGIRPADKASLERGEKKQE